MFNILAVYLRLDSVDQEYSSSVFFNLDCYILDQQQAQEQVLELLPLVSEANAMSEELDKQKYAIS